MTLWQHVKYGAGRKVASVQRNRPYRIKKRIRSFAPIPSSGGKILLLIMAEPRTYWDSLWSAWSWMRHLHGQCRLRLAVDGSISSDQQEVFRRLFPGGELFCNPILPTATGGLQAFCHEHPFGRKVASILQATSESAVLYSDADVLALERPSEIIEALRTQEPFYSMESTADYDPWVLENARRLGLSHIAGLNSGLFFVPHGAFVLEQVHRLMDGWSIEHFHRMTDQALFSVVFHGLHSTQLPVLHYTCSWQGMWFWQDDLDYGPIKVRHFCGTVRHLLYREGMPRLLVASANGTSIPCP